MSAEPTLELEAHAVTSAAGINSPTSRTWLGAFVGYGWATIIVGALAMTATYPGRTHGLGMVTEPLLKSLQLETPEGRVFYASLNLWGTLLGALFCLPMGWMFDRFDRRIVLSTNMILLGGAVLWMSTVQSWQALFGSLILTRGLGQSALSIVSLTLVAKAFDRQRIGMAMAWYAILAMPMHLGLIQVVGWALTDAQFDWRTVWSGVGVMLIVMSASSLCLPNLNFSKPESTRSLLSENEAADSLTNPPPTGSTLGEALRTPAFWVVSLTISLWGMIYSGVALFNVDIFRERGFDEKMYFHVLSLVSIIALGAKIAFGWLVNRVSLMRLLASCLFITALCLAGLTFATQPWHAYLYGVGLGIASGAVALLFFATWGKLFGTRELGRIQSVAQMQTVLASALGPLVFSWGKQQTASYSFVFHCLALVVFTMSLISWFTPVPQHSLSKEHQP